jgi:radical SAM-linked protein
MMQDAGCMVGAEGRTMDGKGEGMPDATSQQRLRICYAKGEPLKYISHLDLARAWERVFRRAGLPVAYSYGFNPRPRFQMAAALPVGVTGRAELLDLRLAEPMTSEEVLSQLRPALPAGLEVLKVDEVDLRLPSLQSGIRAADYRVVVGSQETAAAIQTRIQGLLDAPTLPRQRFQKGKVQSYNLRPFIQRMAVEPGQTEGQVLTMLLQASPEGAGRPDEVLEALGLSLDVRAMERTNLCFEFDKQPGDGIIQCCKHSGGDLLDPTAC